MQCPGGGLECNWVAVGLFLSTISGCRARVGLVVLCGVFLPLGRSDAGCEEASLPLPLRPVCPHALGLNLLCSFSFHPQPTAWVCPGLAELGFWSCFVLFCLGPQAAALRTSRVAGPGSVQETNPGSAAHGASALTLDLSQAPPGACSQSHTAAESCFRGPCDGKLPRLAP